MSIVLKIINRLFSPKKQAIAVDALTGYANWAKNYPAQAHNPLMAAEEQAMLSLMPDSLAGQTCLDLACGSGRYLRHLQSRGAVKLFGADYSPDMLIQAKNPQSPISTQSVQSPHEASNLPKARRAQLPITNLLPLTRSTFLALPFPSESFDFMTCGMAVGHEKDLTRTMAEIGRVLRPGGAVVYSDFHPLATLSGWQRSFTTAGGQTLILEHYLHLYSDHHVACQAAGLSITAVLEPLAEKYASSSSRPLPVVLVIRAIKKA